MNFNKIEFQICNSTLILNEKKDISLSKLLLLMLWYVIFLQTFLKIFQIANKIHYSLVNFKFAFF